MIQKNTMLKVIDNSGANLVQCIHVYKKGFNLGSVSIGDLVKVAIKRLKKSIPKKKVKKSEVVKLLVTSVCSPKNRTSGLVIKDQNNFGVVLNKEQDNIISNRIVFPMFLELRKTKFSKLLTLAPKTI